MVSGNHQRCSHPIHLCLSVAVLGLLCVRSFPDVSLCMKCLVLNRMQASLMHAGLEPKLHLCPDDPNQWQAATSIQCIRQQPVAPGLQALDLSCARFNIAANVTNMFTDELFTDARVVVEGRVWHVHRAMLAPASPILKDASHVVSTCPQQHFVTRTSLCFLGNCGKSSSVEFCDDIGLRCPAALCVSHCAFGTSLAN